jgi:hypothetical protein
MVRVHAVRCPSGVALRLSQLNSSSREASSPRRLLDTVPPGASLAQRGERLSDLPPKHGQVPAARLLDDSVVDVRWDAVGELVPEGDRPSELTGRTRDLQDGGVVLQPASDDDPQVAGSLGVSRVAPSPS